MPGSEEIISSLSGFTSEVCAGKFLHLFPKAPVFSSEKRREKKKKSSVSLTRRLLHPRMDRTLPAPGLYRQDQALLGPGSPPVTQLSAAHPWGPGAPRGGGSPSSRGSARTRAAGRVGNFGSKINWCRNASYFPRNNATQLAGDVFICWRKRPFKAGRGSLCPQSKRKKKKRKKGGKKEIEKENNNPPEPRGGRGRPVPAENQPQALRGCG